MPAQTRQVVHHALFIIRWLFNLNNADMPFSDMAVVSKQA